MPAFNAINVEPEENFEDEIDRTRELQVDEALKLYQTALKLHSQGPRFFDEAADAYHALFESEIFKNPEAQTDFERAENPIRAPLGIEPLLVPGLDGNAGDAEGLGSSLPQTLYLAHKNYGQFLVDRIHHKSKGSKDKQDAVFESADVLKDARRALDDFNAALDRDPADAELWRRTARLAAFLKSARISRYSLEAAIELDDDPAVEEVEPPSLAEGFAGIQLRNQLEVLDDKMAMSHPSMNTFRDRELPPLLKRHLDPAPFLPDPTKDLRTLKSDVEELGPSEIVIDVPTYSWSDLGMSLVKFINDIGPSGQAIYINLPEAPQENQDEDVGEVQAAIDKLQPEAETSDSKATRGSPHVEDVTVEKADETVNDMAPPPTAEETPVVPEEGEKDRTVTIPSRKRSQSAAGLLDQPEEEINDTKRSKRTRRRETAVQEEVMDPVTRLATQLQPYQAADQMLFKSTKNILENLGITDHVTMDRISEVLDSCTSEDRTARFSTMAGKDMRYLLLHFREDLGRAFLSKKDGPELDLTTLLEHTIAGSQRGHDTQAFDEARGLKAFVDRINSGLFAVHDTAFEYVSALTRSYLDYKWSDQMKRAMVQVMSRLDEGIYERTIHEIELLKHDQTTELSTRIGLMVQMLFELHLDVYERITNPNSAVEIRIRIETRWRLGRWHDLADAMMQTLPMEPTKTLPLRFLWASVFYTSLSEAVSQEHILTCWSSLRDCLFKVGNIDITLPNNAIMSEISVSAADKEISKLTTMKFFLGLFQDSLGDPVSVIDMLEPVLNPDAVFVRNSDSEPVDVDDDSDARQPPGKSIADCASQGLQDLWKFLQNSSIELKLFLWARLGEAYGKIDYKTKQFSCLLRSIEMIVRAFDEDTYLNTSDESRKVLFVDMLNSLYGLLAPALNLAIRHNEAFDIIDDEHLKTTASALVKLNCLLHIAAVFEDEIRIGMTQAPASGPTWTAFYHQLREMQVRTWCMQYLVFKVGMYQQKANFPTPDSDLIEYLAAVHQVLGLRKLCKVSSKVIPKIMQMELLKQKNIENWEDHLGQVLYDLYGLKLGVGIWEVQDHGCPADPLPRKQAVQLVDKIMMLANRMSVKDLLKSDLKTTIEHIQQAIDLPKSNPQMMYNFRNFSEYLRKPIHPLRLYQAWKGKVTLDDVTVHSAEASLAEQGWFYLLGTIALTRFKAVDLNRRQTPGAMDDLRLCASHQRLQLQYTPDHWRAWFELAECWDFELDEAVLWSADKMNKDRTELITIQRKSIHCYTLALSYAHRIDPRPALEDEGEALHSLYHHFGMRLYASSREPFAMEPFKHSDQERFFIEAMGAGTFKKIIHEEMSDYKVWKYAASLFRRAIVGKPKNWKDHYMLSKCLWKMYLKDPSVLEPKDRQTKPTVEKVIDALEKTIEVVAALPKPRHGQDPILEPHYKLLTIVSKLVKRGDLDAQEGANILQRQPYACQKGEVAICDKSEWDEYLVKSLRHLRDKDKSNWQHRMIHRHARILLDAAEESEGTQNAMAQAAFTVLRESMFTKTMVMNVWKCDAERPGRHHVYTTQYINLVVRLLEITKDRANMEAVLRRIRKKGADFYHFNELWQKCVLSYVKLLRQSHHIPQNGEDPFKGLTPEDFEIVSEKINEWVTSPAAETHPAVVAMKELSELKKLNASLMKATVIDEIMIDCYAFLYKDVEADLPGPPLSEIVEERNRVKEDTLRAEGAAELKNTLLSGLLNPREGDRESTVLSSLRASPEPPTHGEKMEKQLSSTGDGAPGRGRKPGVRRPDILRKAEQAVLRAAEGPSKAAGGSNGVNGRKARLGSMSSGKNGAATPGQDSEDEGGQDDTHAEGGEHHDDDDDVEMQDGGDQEMHTDGAAPEHDGESGGHASETSSPLGSVHDSADDESELSDVPEDYDENIPPSLMFPNLRRSVDTRTGDSGSTAGDEASEDEEEDGEETDVEETADEGAMHNGEVDDEMHTADEEMHTAEE